MNFLFKRNLVYSPDYRFVIRFICTDFIAKNNSFTINYLINSCGLSQQKAQSLSKSLNLESPTNPNKVLTLFKNNGFSDSQISKIITRHPKLLLSSVDKSLAPKLQFFNSMGLSGVDILCSSPSFFTFSLEKSIIPFFNLVKEIVGTDAKVITVLKRSMLATINAKLLASNVSLLRDHGVPAPSIATFFINQPRTLLRNASRFSEMVAEVEEMKFDPSEYRFLTALQVLDAMSRSSLEAKFDVYRSWGWSEEEVQYAFKMNSLCVLISEKNIMSKMDFFVNKLGYTPSSIAKRPSVLLYGSKRIVSRCSAIHVLITNGKLKKVPSLYSYLPLTEPRFFKKYISKFEKEFPELLSTYQGKEKMIGWEVQGNDRLLRSLTTM